MCHFKLWKLIFFDTSFFGVLSIFSESNQREKALGKNKMYDFVHHQSYKMVAPRSVSMIFCPWDKWGEGGRRNPGYI